MKKALVIIAVITLVLVLCAGTLFAYFAYERMFPMAGPISSPTEGEVVSISLGVGYYTTLELDENEYGAILDGISRGVPTRKWSVNDTPTATVYYKIAVETEERYYQYYLYREDGKFYIEHPYEGVYLTDGHFFEFISSRFDN